MAQTRRKRRTKAEVEEIIEVAREELEEVHPMTLRQVHYRIIGRGDTTYTNTKTDYSQLSKWLVRERLEGRIPWGWIEDRLRRPRSVLMWDSMEEMVELMLSAYRRDVWANQPEYVEVQLEKDALSGIFEQVLRPYGVTLNVGRGYTSWSAIKDAADRYGDGKEVTVLYFGDFDPSGEDMVRSMRENLEELECSPETVKCALTPEDIERYELPPDFTKSSDSRQAAFIEKHGDTAVELDALPVDVLRDRIRSEVEARMDLDALSWTRQLERQDVQELRERTGL